MAVPDELTWIGCLFTSYIRSLIGSQPAGNSFPPANYMPSCRWLPASFSLLERSRKLRYRDLALAEGGGDGRRKWLVVVAHSLDGHPRAGDGVILLRGPAARPKAVHLIKFIPYGCGGWS
jgi:hypothetical protein